MYSKETRKLKHKEDNGEASCGQWHFHYLHYQCHGKCCHRGKRETWSQYFMLFPRCTERMGWSMSRTEYAAPPGGTSHTGWVIAKWHQVCLDFSTLEIGKDQSLNPWLQHPLFQHNYAWKLEGSGGSSASPLFFTYFVWASEKSEKGFILFRKGQFNRQGEG